MSLTVTVRIASEKSRMIARSWGIMDQYILKEWKRTQKQEAAFIHKNIRPREFHWQKRIEQFMPEKLEESLNTAFYKAFAVIFEKGTGILEKTYNKEKKEQEYKVNSYAAELKNSRRNLRAFGRKAKGSQRVNTAISAVEGIGMGVLGMGLPDIPVFLSVLLKSIYEIALHYGFSYETEQEQIFILKLIETSLLHGEELVRGNKVLDEWMEKPYPFENWEEQTMRTADSLAQEMLYLKFVQGIPVVGIVGGVSDVVYQKKITDYAELKYKRRFLYGRLGAKK